VADGHDLIRVHGARVNNLKDVSIEIPKRRLTVFTGVSGSGKSSLVFGTIAAESQRLINETYSAFVQGFMPTLARPEVDLLEGLTTAIIVDQERIGSNPRSTVGTVTDANAMLRIVFSRLGRPHLGSPRAYSFNTPSVTAAGAIQDLRARPLSDSEIELSFKAPNDGTTSLATGYVVKQSTSAISEDNFAATDSLCGGVCHFDGPAVEISLKVGDLDPGVTYHFAVKALNAVGAAGPLATVAVTTTGSPPLPCLPTGVPQTGQVAYPSGYSLVGLPAGTAALAQGPLYSWWNLGAGGSYATADGTETGKGYWAWSACPRLVDLAAPGTSSLTVPLGAYHASIVGNPSGTAPVVVSGQDYSARWNPAANGGVGGYELSGYRASQALALGEGAWVFAYADTSLRIEAAG